MEIYCTQLGMLVEFSYCLSMNEKLPCRNIIGCWKGRMDIVQYIEERFSEEDLRKIFSGLPKTNIDRILDSVTSAHKEE
jgi:hypothetical protein